MTIKEASKLGVLAFQNGKGGAPYQNQVFLHDMYKFVNSKENINKLDSIDLMKAYSNGWHIANIAHDAEKDMPSVSKLKKNMS